MTERGRRKVWHEYLGETILILQALVQARYRGRHFIVDDLAVGRRTKFTQAQA